MARTVYDNQRVFTADVSAKMWKGIPDHIKITTRPATIAYHNGDTILYTGIGVKVYDENDVEIGKVPFDELIFPMEEVDLDRKHNVLYIEGNGIKARIMKNNIYRSGTYNRGYCSDDFWLKTPADPHNPVLYTFSVVREAPSVTYMTLYNNSIYACIIGDYEGDHFLSRTMDGSGDGFAFFGAESGKNGIFRRLSPMYQNDKYYLPYSKSDPSGKLVPSSDVFYMEVPVQWLNPYNDEVLEDTYEIVVEEGSNG